jgi:ElaB/YqjD/DUF883 family membrane-anchored ribosome-binding protein
MRKMQIAGANLRLKEMRMAASTTAKSTSKPTATDQNIDELKAEIAKLRAEMADLAKHASSIGGKSARTARQAAGEKADDLRAQGEAAFDEFRESAKDYERQLTERVREKPITSLAIAAGVGYLFALIARR